jgi:protein-disulfide isomerase
MPARSIFPKSIGASEPMKPIPVLVCAAAVIALAGCNKNQGKSASEQPVKITQVAPPLGGDWTEVVNATPVSFMMGNPNAKVKLVEIGALTCPHCREFDETGAQKLIDKYVKSGQVSWEFRTYLLNGFDIPAVLIARCNGAKTYFPLVRAMYKDQPVWVGKIQATPPAQLEQLQQLPPNQQFVTMAKIAGLQDWAAARGVPVAKSQQCLTDKAKIDQIVQQSSDVTTDYPDFTGTPSFVINGNLLKDTATWEKLEPQLQEALR